MKVFSIAAVVAVVGLTGCATTEQSGQLIGAVAGGIIGNQVGGGAGRAIATGVGAVVGSEAGRVLGSSVDRQNQQPQQPPVVVHQAPTRVVRNGFVVDYSVCSQYYNHQQREACMRGVEQRAREEQHRMNNEAYRAGYGR